MAPLNFKVPTQHASTPLDVARSYMLAGVPVFPCHEASTEELDPATGEFIEKPEKSPRTSNGLRGASVSERIVNIWFGERYPGAVIGLPTGEPLGAWVLDLDRHADSDGTVQDGHEWLAAMEAQHGPLPETARAKTANNGTHIFFRDVLGLRNRAAIAPGVDTRGTGGYVVAPGSVMADGRRYEWVDPTGTPYIPNGLPEFADAPDWLLELLAKPEVPTPTGTYTPPSGDNTRYVEAAVQAEISQLVATRSGRNQAINQAAFNLGTLVGAGVLSRSEAEAHLMEAARANGYIAKDGERAARQTIASGLKSGMQSPRQIPEREQDTTRAVDVGQMVANGLKKKAEPQLASATTSATALAPPPVAVNDNAPVQPRVRERFEKTWFDHIEEGKPKETFIKGVFGLEEFTTVSGLPGTGKSVIVTDMACHVAAGKEWHGRRVRQGLVVYVAAERKKLTERRMMAFRKRHGVSEVPLLVIGGRLDFTRNLDDARALVAVIQEAEMETDLKCIWVIIDTLTRVFGAGDQNASKDMVKFVQSCDEIISETKAHVTAIHHTAWAGERMKGAIDLDGAVDASFMVKKDHGKYKLNCNGTNDGEEGDILTFTMESIVLGQDEDGEPTTAPVVAPATETRLTSGGPKGMGAKVLAALSTAIEKEGVEPKGPAFPDDVLVVKEDAWRAAFYEANGGMTDTNRKRFAKHLDLVKDGVVRRVGEWFWVA